MIRAAEVGQLPSDVDKWRAIRNEIHKDLHGEEGALLICSFWLVDALHGIGRNDEATEMFDKLCGLANDVGLLAEEFDPLAGVQVGNFPQAFSHLALVNSARRLVGHAPSPAFGASARQ